MAARRDGNFETRAYGYQMHESYLFFWPDSRDEEGTAVVTRLKLRIYRGSRNGLTPFWGYFRGIITRDTLYQSANRFYETDTRNPKEISKHPVSGGWILKGPKLPTVTVYRIPATAEIVYAANKNLELLRESPPVYSAAKKLFCTPLVRDVLYDSGLEFVQDLDVRRPVSFAEGFEALVENKSSQIEKEVRVLGIVDDGVAEPKFTWILSQEE